MTALSSQLVTIMYVNASFVSVPPLTLLQGDVYIWRMSQQDNETFLQPCRVFRAHKEYLTRLLLSPDIRLLATCSADHTVKIWNIDPSQDWLEKVDIEAEFPGMTPQTPTASSQSLPSTFGKSHTPQSANGTNFSSSFHSNPSSPGAAMTPFTASPLISHRRPLPLQTTLENHQRWVWDCAFSADSAYLVTVCSDHYARLWELSSSTIIRQYSGHHRGAVCVALNDYSGNGG